MKKELKLRKKYIESNCSHKVIKENIKTNSKTYLNSMPYILHLTSDLRGITLIALIITIIVMLILVGVTVSITINGGLFDKSKQAVDEYVITQEKEQVELAYVSAALNKSEDNVSADELQNELIKSVGKDKTLTTDNGDGTLTVFLLIQNTII